MRLKVLGCVALFFALVMSAHATTVLKGSVAAKGSKVYSFTPNGNGHVQVTLMYDNATSDLDLAVGFTDSNGEAVLIGSGTSTLKQFERCEAGVDPNITYSVVVNSYKGSSAYRIYVTTTTEEAFSVASTQPATLQEVDMNHMSDKLESTLNRIQKAQRK